jgi:ribosome-associated translation inhibitor RaiA
MQIQVRTDNHIHGDQRLDAYVESVVSGAVERFTEHLTHVDAHLGDVNGHGKSGPDDMRCLLEARVTGLKNIAVSHQAESLDQAIDGAAGKLTRALQSALGKLEDREHRSVGTGHLSADIAADVPVEDLVVELPLDDGPARTQ